MLRSSRKADRLKQETALLDTGVFTYHLIAPSPEISRRSEFASCKRPGWPRSELWLSGGSSALIFDRQTRVLGLPAAGLADFTQMLPYSGRQVSDGVFGPLFPAHHQGGADRPRFEITNDAATLRP